MYQALYRKYRPKNLNEVWGQDTIVKIIKNTIAKNKINHAYLFTGPRGTGKTSIAKIFAKMVNCENLQEGIPCGQCVSCMQTNNSDIIEIDAASNNGVDEIRELRNKINLVPAFGKYKIYIIDEVHMLTTGAFNALLKTLEEPPSHVIFVLATTDPHKIPETILSRLQRLDFKKISTNNIVNRLKQITEVEKIDIEEEALYEIANLSDGGMRDSIGMLDQAIAYSENKITVQDIHDINGTLTPLDLSEIIEQIQEKNIEKLLKKFDYYNDCGKNFVKLTEELIVFLKNVLLYKEAPEYFQTINTQPEIYRNIKEKIRTNDILYYIKLLNECTLEMYNTNNTKLLLELTVIKMIGKPKSSEKQDVNEKVTSDTKKRDEETKANQSNIIEKQKETTLDTPKTAQQQTNVRKIDNQSLQNIKKRRIENTLAQFSKKTLRILQEKIQNLNNFILDPDLSKYASIILDGQLKAASEEYLIFVFKSERTATLFNENIPNIETTLNKVFENTYKAIATDINHWETIKSEFNSKKIKYIYQKEEKDIEKLYNNQPNQSDLSAFEDIIEYE
ncbi:MAG: DNA polymerase III subunit gamma/tau [Bacilli bacterium]|nr:DNA polymerase III subunit gamma/tau [Bacilli bacterium]